MMPEFATVDYTSQDTTRMFFFPFYLSMSAVVEQLIHTFISSCLDVYNSLFTCLNDAEVAHLKLEQNSAVRLVTNARCGENISPVLAELHWLPNSFQSIFLLFN